MALRLRPSVRTVSILTAATVVAASVLTSAFAEGPDAIVKSTATLPDTDLAALINSGRAGTVADGRGMLLGGIGSDLWHEPTDPENVFWAITDRGPNGQIDVAGSVRRTFPIPDFSPTIMRIEITAEGRIVPRDILPILGQSGKPVTGLSNLDRVDETPYDYAAAATFPFNQSGLDTEGLVRTANGDFWVVDEYSPSIVRIDSSGKVVKRYVPVGVALPQADYPVSAVLPAIFAKRRGNRGLESLAISPDGKTLYTAIQSPLRVPDNATGDNSRNIRLLAFDIASEKVTAEYVYQFQPYQEFQAARADDMKISGLAAIDAANLLVLERTDAVAKIYRVDLSKATNILGTKWDDLAARPSLEGVADVSKEAITPLPKSLVVNLDTVPGMPDKVEGMAILGPKTIAVMNDNDFGISTFDAGGKHININAPTKLFVLDLPGGFTGIPAPFEVTRPTAPLPPATGSGADGDHRLFQSWAAFGAALVGLGALALVVRRRS